MAFTIDQALTSLRNARDNDRLGHAYLITGPAGSGKEKLACQLIALLQSQPAGEPEAGLFGDEPAAPAEVEPAASLDAAAGPLVNVVRPASAARRIRVADIHELEKSLRVSCGLDETKVAVICEADRLGVESSNAFLKTLEEPPDRSIILILTSRPEQLLDTILSRCIQIDLIGDGMIEPEAGSPEAQWLNQIGSALQTGGSTVKDAFVLARATQDVLGQRKAEIDKHYQTILKEESKRYKDASEAGKYLERRETQLAARGKSDYLKVREGVVQMLIALFGDAVRAQVGGQRRSLPRYANVAETLASQLSHAELEKRMKAVERLGELANTNVQENLAFEASFLDIVGVE